jgi:hypothetical protein
MNPKQNPQRSNGLRDSVSYLTQPRKFVKRVEASEDLEELKRWFDAALTAAKTFAKTVDGAA